MREGTVNRSALSQGAKYPNDSPNEQGTDYKLFRLTLDHTIFVHRS
jgi:hypothetical protein